MTVKLTVENKEIDTAYDATVTLIYPSFLAYIGVRSSEVYESPPLLLSSSPLLLSSTPQLLPSSPLLLNSSSPTLPSPLSRLLTPSLTPAFPLIQRIICKRDPGENATEILTCAVGSPANPMAGSSSVSYPNPDSLSDTCTPREVGF